MLLPKHAQPLEHFRFETLCVSNHTACRFAEKAHFSAHFGPGGAVPPPRVSSFLKVKRLKKSALGEGWGVWGEGNTPCALEQFNFEM